MSTRHLPKPLLLTLREAVSGLFSSLPQTELAVAGLFMVFAYMA